MNLIEIAQMTEPQARKYLEKIRWPNGPICPHCEDTRIWKVKSKAARPGVYKCRGCRRQFTVTVGTVMHSSKVTLRQWILAFHLMCSSKKGISALQLQRNLGLGSYKTVWHLAHRIRLAMQESPLQEMLGGIVEVDETYIGGKSHEGIRGRGSERKTPVLVLVERDGRAVSKPVEHVDAANLKGTIRELADKNSTIMTDEWPSYRGIGKEFAGGHGVVQHKLGIYTDGICSTNSAESFFSLLKRGVHGTFHHVSTEHLFRYCNEFSFRWSNRKVDDSTRTELALQDFDGKRLMYEKMVQVKPLR